MPLVTVNKIRYMKTMCSCDEADRMRWDFKFVRKNVFLNYAFVFSRAAARLFVHCGRLIANVTAFRNRV